MLLFSYVMQRTIFGHFVVFLMCFFFLCVCLCACRLLVLLPTS
jgi:hypothetical protein